VHIIHDYREQRGRYRMSPSAAVAVVVDSSTTIVGFGSLMVASHQGLVSLGRVLTLGVTCCLFTSMIMLPALLAWMSWNRGQGTEPEIQPELDIKKKLPPSDVATQPIPRAWTAIAACPTRGTSQPSPQITVPDNRNTSKAPV